MARFRRHLEHGFGFRVGGLISHGFFPQLCAHSELQHYASHFGTVSQLIIAKHPLNLEISLVTNNKNAAVSSGKRPHPLNN